MAYLRQSKVVGGSSEPPVALPSSTQASIVAFVNSNGKPFCTGTCIRPYIVLTAAHCEIEVGTKVTVGPDTLHPTAFAYVSEVASNPGWHEFVTGDQMLVRLDRSLPVSPIEVASFVPEIGADVITVGYGLTQAGAPAQTQRWWLDENVENLGTGWASVEGGGVHGLCFGDSGGPLLVLDPTTNTYVVAGTVSQGDYSCTGEDKFALVGASADFITRTLSAWNGPKPLPVGLRGLGTGLGWLGVGLGILAVGILVFRDR